MDNKDLLLVHIGAGFHSPKLNTAYRKLLKAAVGAGLLQSSAEVVERSWLTNSGRGSNVDRNGYASLDATYIKVEHGKVKDILSLIDICDANPTKALTQAKSWLDSEFSTESLSTDFGLLRPLSLVYSQFQKFAGFERTDSDSLVSQSTRRAYKKVKDCFDIQGSTEYNEDVNKETNKRQRVSDNVKFVRGLSMSKAENTLDDEKFENSEQFSGSKIEDTVGVVEMSWSEKNCKIDAVTSSGGNFFKIPGRISCAGIFGAGLAFSSQNNVQVVTMCTGNGDDILRLNLASFLSDTIAANLKALEEKSESIGEFLVSSITRRSSMFELSAVDSSGSLTIYLGAVVVVITPKKKVIVYCHSTESFYFAFRLKDGVEVVMSRKEKANGGFLHGEYNIK